jgi:hypothetical protein
MNIIRSGFENIHGKCGIINVCLNDPLSELINKIRGLDDDEYNSVGFYYEEGIPSIIDGNGNNKIFLFNTYDNDLIPWIRFGCSMDFLLSSPFVKKIRFYPINYDKNIDSKSLLASKEIISNINNRENKNIKMEDLFRMLVVETIGNNYDIANNKNMSYTSLFFKIAGIDYNYERNITGYSLVNKILLKMMGIKSIDMTKISKKIIPCALLKKPSSLIFKKERVDEIDIKNVIEGCRDEIAKMAAIFIDLFTADKKFREKFLEKISNRSDPTYNKLDNLFLIEKELVSHVINGLKNGFLSNFVLNEIIIDLNNERYDIMNKIIGNKIEDITNLPLSFNPKKNIEIIQESMSFTFQDSSNQNIIKKSETIRKLGVYINDIIKFPSENMVIDMGIIIDIYNEIIKDTDIPKISVSEENTISKNVTIVIPGEYSDSSLKMSNDISISMYNSDLSRVSESQLLDILIYIDSLCDTDGISDNRFSNLQNRITRELGLRQKVKK